MNDRLKTIKSDLMKLVTGSALAFGGALLGNGLVYLYGIIFARYFGAESVGFFFLSMLSMQIISGVGRVGLAEGLLRFVAIHAGNNDSARVKGTILSSFRICCFSSLPAGILLFVFAAPLSVRLFGQPDLSYYLKWFAVILPLFTLLNIAANAIQALKRMDYVVLSRDIIQPVTMFVLSLAFFGVVRGPTGFLAGYAGSVLVALAAALFYLHRACPALLSKTPAIFEWRTLLAFSLPVTGNDIAHYLFRWSDTFFLSFFRTPSEVGIYNAALRTTLLLNLLAVSVTALYAPIIAAHHHQGRYSEVQRILRILLRWCLTLALPVVLLMVLFSRDILMLWGTAFVAGESALRVLAVSRLFFIASSLLSFTMVMCGRQYVELGNTFFVCSLNIALNLLLIPEYGIDGAAGSMLCAHVAGFILRLIETGKLLKIDVLTPKCLKPVFATILVFLLFLTFDKPLFKLLGGLSSGTHPGRVILMLLFMGAAYMAMLFLMGFESEDRFIWKELKNKIRSGSVGK